MKMHHASTSCIVYTWSVEPSHIHHVDRYIWISQFITVVHRLFPNTYVVGSHASQIPNKKVCQYEYRQHGSIQVGSSTFTIAIIMFSVEKVSMCRVSADHIGRSRNAGQLLVEVREVDGKNFFKLAKTTGMARMLCTDGSFLEKALTGLEVISKITDLRDTKFRLSIGSKKNVSLKPAAKAKKLMIEGTIASVHTPSIAGIDGRDINVLLDTPGSHLWVEAEPDTLAYLVKVVTQERANVRQNEQPKPRTKLESTIELPDSEMIELKSGAKAGYIRVHKRMLGEGNHGDEISPEKLQKYHYVKIDHNNPDAAVNAALRWKSGEVDAATDENEDNISEHEQ